ncbi:hypothetical protein [Alkalihalobacillus sp. AL-G]|uniref:hypothetical protein n=1 Tax=Alkalihalobacillus sp. AL-G TaxID=2926399 RepID=UPI00272A51F0|nr:hypothetical protein [Alkalihalobacillus sp. AL-G]WLD91817.1 hypothetical protein MOJ78_12285 [Alkalihalobacillus sp. AL-G]
MEYILENVWTTDEEPKKKNVHVKNSIVSYVSERPLKMKCMTVNTSGLHVIPGFVMRDFSLEGMDTESLLKRCKQLISTGCTTVVTTFSIRFAKELEGRYNRLVEHLSVLPIDYVIGLSLPMTRITPSLIRTCQKKKIPFIYGILEQEEDIDTVIWEWIRNVNFPYTIPIIAGWEQLALQEKRLMQLQDRWSRVSKSKSITTIKQLPLPEQPFTKYHLQELGIYPQKGSWVTGCDIDYVIYEQDTPLAAQSRVQYDESNQPVLVVRKGTALKVGDDIYINPGEGKQLQITRPGLFRAMSNDLL